VHRRGKQLEIREALRVKGSSSARLIVFHWEWLGMTWNGKIGGYTCSIFPRFLLHRGYGKNIAKLAPPDDASGNMLVSKK
jgi:hypothetical protein